MPEHVHLLIYPKDKVYSIPRILRAVKAPAAKEILKAIPSMRDKCRVSQSHGPDEFRFWMAGGGYDKNICHSRVAWAEVRYINNNPVRRGLVQSPDEWDYSSARNYLDPSVQTRVLVTLCRAGIE
jgi:putative transposase